MFAISPLGAAALLVVLAMLVILVRRVVHALWRLGDRPAAVPVRVSAPRGRDRA